jgi:hypothetical protein
MNFPRSMKNKFSSKASLWQRLLIVLIPTHIAREVTISTIVIIIKIHRNSSNIFESLFTATFSPSKRQHP